MEDTIDELAGWASDDGKNAGMIIPLGVVTAIADFLALVMPWAGVVGLVSVVGLAVIQGGAARIAGALGGRSFDRGTLACIGGGFLA